jgi:hypothetical protein
MSAEVPGVFLDCTGEEGRSHPLSNESFRPGVVLGAESWDETRAFPAVVAGRLLEFWSVFAKGSVDMGRFFMRGEERGCHRLGVTVGGRRTDLALEADELLPAEERFARILWLGGVVPGLGLMTTLCSSPTASFIFFCVWAGIWYPVLMACMMSLLKPTC